MTQPSEVFAVTRDADGGFRLTRRSALAASGAVGLAACSAPGSPAPAPAPAPASPQGVPTGLFGTASGGDPAHCSAPAHQGTVEALATLPGKGLLASAGGEGAVRLWTVPDGSPLRTWTAHSGPASVLAASADGGWVASGGADQIVYLWRPSGSSPAASLVGHVNVVTDLAFAPDGSWLASAAQDATVRVWALPGGDLQATIQVGPGYMRFALARSGALLAVTDTNDVRVLEMPSGRTRLRLVGDNQDVSGRVRVLAVDPAGTAVAAGCVDARVRLWSLTDGRALPSLAGHPDAVSALAFAPDGSYLATASTGLLALWDPATWRQLASFALPKVGEPRALAIAPDASWIAVAPQSQAVWLIDVAKKTARALGEEISSVEALAVGTDGSWLAAGSADGMIRRWAMPQGDALACLAAPASAPTVAETTRPAPASGGPVLPTDHSTPEPGATVGTCSCVGYTVSGGHYWHPN